MVSKNNQKGSNKHKFKNAPFFVLNEDSIRQLEKGEANIELILDFRKELFSSDALSKVLEEKRFGTSEKQKNGEEIFKFPEKYTQLIEQRIKEKKLIRVVVIKKEGTQVIELNPPQKLSTSLEKKNPEFDAGDKKYQQVLCEILNFPGLTQDEYAYLTYVGEDFIDLPDISENKKGIQLHHLIPWNIDKEKINNIIQSKRLGVYVSSNTNRRLYLTEECRNNLLNQHIVVFSLPYYASPEKLEKIFPGEKTLGENAIISITIKETQLFNQEQYKFAHDMSLVVLTSQLQLGGNDRLLLGKIFIPTDPRMPVANVNTLNGELSNGAGKISFFYLYEGGLNRLGIDCRIIQVEAINNHTIISTDDWKKIVMESRLVGQGLLIRKIYHFCWIFLDVIGFSQCMISSKRIYHAKKKDGG